MGLKLQSTWGTHNLVLKVAWVGVALYWGSAPGSGQGHIKVRLRSNRLKYWITTFFYSVHMFLLQGSVPLGYSWHNVAGKPSNTHSSGEGGGVQWFYVAWRGNIPPLYHPSSLISPPVLALTSGQNEVNWSLEEHGLHVTKDLRHPHLDIKGDMGWGCPLLGFYSRLRIRSY